jgi:CRISPR system Cascade subunit CasA
MATAIAKMRKARSVAWLLPMLGGCMHYQPQPAAPATVLDTRDQRDIDPNLLAKRIAALAPKAAGRAVTWDRLDLFAAATLYNPEIRSARAALATAAANARAARAATGPNLTLTSEYARDPAASSRWLVGGLIDIPIDAGGRRRSRLEVADIATLGAQYDLAETVWTVRMAICRALAAQFIAQRQVAILTTLEAIRARQLESAERRLAAGEIARGDVERVRNDGADIARRLNDAQATGRTARQALAAAIGLPESALADITPTWDKFDAAAPDPTLSIDAEHRRAAILARADILHALGNYQSAEAELRGEVAKQYPAITLSPGYTWERGLVKIPFSLGLVLPPLDLNRRAILAAETKRAEAGARMEAAIAGAAAAIDTAMVETRASRAALARIRDHERPIAERLAAQADLALKAGTIDRVDWAAAQAGVSLAELAEIDALARIHAADAALEDAARSPLEGPETMTEDKRDMAK